MDYGGHRKVCLHALANADMLMLAIALFALMMRSRLLLRDIGSRFGISRSAPQHHNPFPESPATL